MMAKQGAPKAAVAQQAAFLPFEDPQSTGLGDGLGAAAHHEFAQDRRDGMIDGPLREH